MLRIPCQFLFATNDFGEITELIIVTARGFWQFDILKALLELSTRSIEREAHLRWFQRIDLKRPALASDVKMSARKTKWIEMVASDCRDRGRLVVDGELIVSE